MELVLNGKEIFTYYGIKEEIENNKGITDVILSDLFKSILDKRFWLWAEYECFDKNFDDREKKANDFKKWIFSENGEFNPGLTTEKIYDMMINFLEKDIGIQIPETGSLRDLIIENIKNDLCVPEPTAQSINKDITKYGKAQEIVAVFGEAELNRIIDENGEEGLSFAVTSESELTEILEKANEGEYNETKKVYILKYDNDEEFIIDFLEFEALKNLHFYGYGNPVIRCINDGSKVCLGANNLEFHRMTLTSDDFFEIYVPNESSFTADTQNIKVQFPDWHEGYRNWADVILRISIDIYDDWLYYNNKRDNYSLYKMRLDGSCKEKLNDEPSAGIIAKGGFIYYAHCYLSYGRVKQRLYKIRPDGSGKTLLTKNDIIVIDSVEEDGWIYFVSRLSEDSTYGLFKMRADGSQKTMIVDNIKGCDGNIHIYNGWIYYTSGHISDRRICKARADGGEVLQLTDGESYNLVVSKGSIYYNSGYDNGCLYKIDENGIKTKITDIRYRCFAASDKWLYCVDTTGHRAAIFRMTPEGAKKEYFLNTDLDFLYLDYNFKLEGGYAYYINQWDQDNIFKTSESGGLKQKLSDISECNSFAINENWIYFASSSSIYKMRPDGTGGEGTSIKRISGNIWGNIALSTDGKRIYYINAKKYWRLFCISEEALTEKRFTYDTVSSASVFNKWVYFSDISVGGMLYRKQDNGTVVENITNDKTTMYTSPNEGVLFYRNDNNGKLYKTTLAENKKEKLTDDEITSLASDGTWAYFCCSDGLCKIHKNGSGRMILYAGECGDLKVYGEWIYFCNNGDGDKLYRVNKDGGNLSCLCRDKCYNIIPQNGWVYYINGSDLNRIYRIPINGDVTSKLLP